ncbi:hypothetical protein U8V72_23230 [Priestia filamentosa]|uniref:hypothetical protein n=1 Tax=Priestia filamentosa TaxID=1402861 RepID=UPI0012E02B60
MKLDNCYKCGNYNDKEEMELIDGYYYCYNCYDFCASCGKSIPVDNGNNHCKTANKD